MPYVADSIWVNVSSSGVADFTIGAALSGYRDFIAAAVPNGSIVHYSARTATEFENGEGTYNAGVVSRTTVYASSAGAPTKTNFGSPPTLAIAPLAEDVLLVGEHSVAVPAGAWKAKTTNGATAGSYGDVNMFSFQGSTATANRVRWLFPMPKSWNEGTIKFRIAGTVQAGTAGEKALFKMAAKAFSNGDAGPALADLSVGAQQVEMLLPATPADKVIISPFSSALTIDGTPAEGDIVEFELWRDPNDAIDNSTATFILFSCLILMTLNAGTDT